LDCPELAAFIIAMSGGKQHDHTGRIPYLANQGTPDEFREPTGRRIARRRSELDGVVRRRPCSQVARSASSRVVQWWRLERAPWLQA